MQSLLLANVHIIKHKQSIRLIKNKVYGPDPQFNPRLGLEIDKAKKSGMPKALIEAAIARGQGKSTTGAALENVTIEAILPANVAVVVDFETDSRLRTLADTRLIVKKAGGNVTPTGYLFEKKGRITYAAKEGIGADEALEVALEAGALDIVEGEEGKLIVYTAPAETKAIAEKMSSALGLEIEASEIIHDPVEDTKVDVDGAEDFEVLKTFVERVQEEGGFQGVYINARPGPQLETQWKELEERLSS